MTSTTIGANVTMNENSFDGNFPEFYNQTYTWRYAKWWVN